MSFYGWAKKKKSLGLPLSGHMTTWLLWSSPKIITSHHNFTARFKNVLIIFSAKSLSVLWLHYCKAMSCAWALPFAKSWTHMQSPSTGDDIRIDPICSVREATLYRKLITLSSVVVSLWCIKCCQQVPLVRPHIYARNASHQFWCGCTGKLPMS